jgi:hypothetical protein
VGEVCSRAVGMGAGVGDMNEKSPKKRRGGAREEGSQW